MTSPSAAPSHRRFDAVDVARGVAIVAMVIYHFSWDLTALQFIATDVTREPAWRFFARSIASSFLALVGIGLVLAHAQGLRRGPFLRRLAKVGGAALLITAVTYAAFPQSYIFFGILHCIAAGSVLALPFLRAPAWLVIAVAAFCIAAPRILTDPVFDRPALEWLGLGSQEPTTNDYVPVLPWLAAILVGLVLGRFLTGRRAPWVARWRARGALSRALLWAGRWSLPIYLIHQVVLFGALSGVREIVGPNPVVQCTQDCSRRSGDAAQCRASCTCVVATLRERGALDRIMAGPPGKADQAILDEAARMCRRRP